jgi:uncharacterized protein YndB with AHSA1/START domain
MSSIDNSRARAVADLSEGCVLASVEISAAPERIFRALASDEIVDWWVRPGVFRTTKWAGDVRVGGRWRACGEVNGQVSPSKESSSRSIRRESSCTPGTWPALRAPRRRTYLLEPLDQGTRITLRHTGFTSPEACTSTSVGWETSFERLAEILAGKPSPGGG